MDKPTQTVSTDTLGRVLMLTDRRIQQLTSEGVLIKETRGKYPLIPNVQNYIKYWQERAAGSDAGQTDIATESLRLKKLTADKMHLEVDQMRGKLIPVDVILETWEPIVGAARAKILALPSKIKSQIPGLRVKDIAKIKTMVRGTLEDLANSGIPKRPGARRRSSL